MTDVIQRLLSLPFLLTVQLLLRAQLPRSLAQRALGDGDTNPDVTACLRTRVAVDRRASQPQQPHKMSNARTVGAIDTAVDAGIGQLQKLHEVAYLCPEL